MRIFWLGQVPYSTALALQADLALARRAGAVFDMLLLLTHPPTITMGRAAADEHVLSSPDDLVRNGVTLHRVNRGGDVTYHDPGQLIGYPILDLALRGSDIHAYLRLLEQVIIDALTVWGISASRKPPHTGVWVHDRKIAAMGIAVRRWITTHGFAVNVSADLTGFQLIVPCGIREYGVTSISAETSLNLTPEAAIAPIARAFLHHFPSYAAAPASPNPLSPTTRKILSEALDLTESIVLDSQALGR